MSFLTLPNDIGLGGEGPPFCRKRKPKKQDMEGKTDQESLKNAGILTGVFEGLLKASSFLTVPTTLASAAKRRRFCHKDH